MPSKKSRLRLYADECFPVTSVTFLKSLGYSVVHAYDLKYTGKSDQFHLKAALKLGRILITLDRDFLFYKLAPLVKHPGIVVISTESTPVRINTICKKVFPKISPDSIREAIYIVTFEKIIKSKHGVRTTSLV